MVFLIGGGLKKSMSVGRFTSFASVFVCVKKFFLESLPEIVQVYIETKSFLQRGILRIFDRIYLIEKCISFIIMFACFILKLFNKKKWQLKIVANLT